MDLEDKIINILKESENKLIDISKQFKIRIPKHSVNIKSENKDYSEIDLDKYLPIISSLNKNLQEYHNTFSSTTNDITKDRKELKKIKTYIKQQNKIFGDLYHVGLCEEDIDSVNSDFVRISSAVSELNFEKNKINDISKNLSILKRINDSKIYISNEEVESTLYDLFDGTINRSRALKIILKKPEEPKKTIVEKIERIIRKEPTQKYKPKIYDGEDINFLKTRGITGKKAKNLLESYDFFEKKDFMLNLENSFNEKGYTSSEVYPIYKNHNVLDLDNGDAQDYIDAIDDLLDSYEGVRGILPRFRKRRFKSAKKIRSLIKEDNPKVYIEGLTMLDNRKDRDNLEKQLLLNPFNTGRRITKRSKVANASLYDTCVNEFGHTGHFRRESFGNRRVLFEVSRNKDNTLTVELFKYFENHNEYDDFYL